MGAAGRQRAISAGAGCRSGWRATRVRWTGIAGPSLRSLKRTLTVRVTTAFDVLLTLSGVAVTGVELPRDG